MGSLEARRVAEGDRDARADRRAFRPQAAAACGRYRIRGRTDAELVGRGEGYRPHIPVNDKSKRDDGTFSRSDFRYDPADDVYHCPGGKRLGTSGTVHEGKTLLYREKNLTAMYVPSNPKEPSHKILRDIHERARDVARSFAGSGALSSRNESARRSRCALHTSNVS